MKAIPYISTELLVDKTAAFFAIRLSEIATQEEDEQGFSRRILNQQSDFIASLVGLGESASVELRVFCMPNPDFPHRGKINIALRVRLLADSVAAANAAALALYQSFMPNVLSISDCYQWLPVATAEDYQALFCGAEGWHVRELVRRERQIVLDPGEESAPRDTIGFAPQADTIKAEKDKASAYIYFPFLRNYDTFEGLFVELLYQNNPTVISIRLDPTHATEREYNFTLEQLLTSERYMQLPLSGSIDNPADFYPSFRTQAQSVADKSQQALNILRDDVFMTTIHVMSNAPLSQMLCESIGVAITEHLHTNDPDSDMSSQQSLYSGGYDWLRPESDGDNALALQKLQVMEETTFAAGLLDPEIRIRRLFDINQASCVFRLPIPVAADFPGLETRQVVNLPPPESSEGVFIGVNSYQSGAERVHMQDIDRLRHTYVLGKTGTGKSTFLKNLILQDILAGKGVGIFDPHGELIADLIPSIPPERLADVILIEPENGVLAVGLNILDVETDLEKDSVINYLLEVFETLFNMQQAGGPIFEMYFRNTLLLLWSDDNVTPTLLDIQRIFEDKAFRSEKLEKCNSPTVASFWRYASDIQGESNLDEMGNYISSKLVRFTHSHVMKMICCQQKSTIDFEDIIENQKILLVNLSKGELGDTSSHFLGMILIKMMQTVAFRRKMGGNGERPIPFYMYVDEFQNLATPTFVNLLSESRKYGLAMTLANQYLDQVPDDIRESIMGNIGSTVNFRVGSDDAKQLENGFAPYIRAKDFIRLPNYYAYVSMLVGGNVGRPFNILTEHTQFARDPKMRGLIYAGMGRYARPIDEIQREFSARHQASRN